ncbi:MAG TPA: VOC family protein [Actinomycetota bacterium]|nr:VOC family protein [Actinomycetota bacterium]
MGNKVIHFEIATSGDAAGLQKFYSDAFDWKIDADNPMNYGMVDAGTAGLAGGIGPAPSDSGHVTVYIEVDDLNAALDKVEKLGGKTVTPPMDVPGGPALAHFADPSGNFIGLVKGM